MKQFLTNSTINIKRYITDTDSRGGSRLFLDVALNSEEPILRRTPDVAQSVSSDA